MLKTPVSREDMPGVKCQDCLSVEDYVAKSSPGNESFHVWLLKEHCASQSGNSTAGRTSLMTVGWVGSRSAESFPHAGMAGSRGVTRPSERALCPGACYRRRRRRPCWAQIRPGSGGCPACWCRRRLRCAPSPALQPHTYAVTSHSFIMLEHAGYWYWCLSGCALSSALQLQVLAVDWC